MLDDLQRKLEIGSHSERLRAVRELGAMNSREAYGLLQLAADDIDPQIQDEARRMMEQSLYYSGASASRVRDAAPENEVEGQEGLF